MAEDKRSRREFRRCRVTQSGPIPDPEITRRYQFGKRLRAPKPLISTEALHRASDRPGSSTQARPHCLADTFREIRAGCGGNDRKRIADQHFRRLIGALGAHRRDQKPGNLPWDFRCLAASMRYARACKRVAHLSPDESCRRQRLGPEGRAPAGGFHKGLRPVLPRRPKAYRP